MGGCSSKAGDAVDAGNDKRNSVEFDFANFDNVVDEVGCVCELERGSIKFIKDAELGAGYFGSVVKALCDETATGGVPGYLVAVKYVVFEKECGRGRKTLSFFLKTNYVYSCTPC